MFCMDNGGARVSLKQLKIFEFVLFVFDGMDGVYSMLYLCVLPKAATARGYISAVMKLVASIQLVSSKLFLFDAAKQCRHKWSVCRVCACAVCMCHTEAYAPTFILLQQVSADCRLFVCINMLCSLHLLLHLHISFSISYQQHHLKQSIAI